jgi:hypothetical protein
MIKIDIKNQIQQIFSDGGSTRQPSHVFTPPETMNEHLQFASKLVSLRFLFGLFKLNKRKTFPSEKALAKTINRREI